MPGANLEGLHYVKNIRKAMEFDKLLDHVKRVAVIGASPLGVEMAGNLGHRGLEVDFIDEGPWVLSEVLDPDVAEPVHESLVKRGVTLRLGTKVEAFVGDDHVRAVATSDGELPCDVAIICLEKIADTALAEAAGLETRHDRRRSSSTTTCARRRRVRGGRRDRGAARADDAADPRADRLARVRAGPDRGGQRRPGETASTTRSGSRGAWSAATTRSAASRSARRSRRAMGIPYVLAKGVGVSRARYFPGATKTHVKLLAEPDTLRMIGGQIHGGEGVKERCDFLAFAAKRGATIEDLAWMENIYSPPIGALFEPIAIAAQNGLAALRDGERAAEPQPVTTA